MRNIVVIAHDMRSTFNVGSLLRTADGLGVSKLYLTGYTPYPKTPDDTRLPHIADKLDKQIDKTALGAQALIDWEYRENISELINELRQKNYQIIALEQTPGSEELPGAAVSDNIAIILGTEVTGLPNEIIRLTDKQVLIPMLGGKESFNVVIAAAIALYEFRFR